MHRCQSSLTCRILAVAFAVSVFAGSAFATTEKVVYAFLGQPDGINPNAGLVADVAGNLYGTTTAGGTDSSCSCGTIFELSPPAFAGGAWTETILYSFQGGANDGARPFGTLIFDKAGNLYGTSLGGGSNNPGTVFELSPPATAGGAWTETVILFFAANFAGGASPEGKLAMDAEGDLFGTAQSGGKSGEGVVFEILKPKVAGKPWVGKVLHSFGQTDGDGFQPGSNIVFRNGVIFGTTANAGTHWGTIFRLVNNSGTWTYSILFDFNGNNGSAPWGGVIIDKAGNLYGTANGGGINGKRCDPQGCGVIFELSPPATAGGSWTETTLYEFTGAGDGANPYGTLWIDALGNLYGTASQGGKTNTTGAGGPTLGTVYKLKAPVDSGGTWTLQLLHDFGGIQAGDGNFPLGELILVNGLLYGTTDLGGNEFSNGGTVFSVVP